MTLYWLIFFIISFFAFKNWKGTMVLWLPVQLLFNECVCLKYTSPALTLVLAVDIVLLFAYYRIRHKIKLKQDKFFFKEVFIAYLISYLLSMLFSIVPIREVFTNTIKYFITNFLVLFLFQKALISTKEIHLFYKGTFIVTILMVGLGAYETIAGDNPVLDFVYLNAPLDAIDGKMYYIPPFLNYTGELSQRFGMARAFSFFNIHIAFGCACVLYLYYYAYMFRQKFIPNIKYFLLAGIILLLIGIFLSNSKTPIVGLIIFTLGIFSFKDVTRPRIILFVIAFISILYIYAPNYINNVIALFDNNVAEDGGGSNTLMRIRQFEIGLNLFYQSPLTGNGVGSISTFMKSVSNTDLLGAESSWLKILPERGLIGVIAYLYLYLMMYKKVRPYMNKKSLVCFLIGLMAMETATGFMSMPIYGSILIAIYQMGKNKKQTRTVNQIREE